MAHWPDNPPVSVKRVLDLRKGDPSTVSEISMGSHTATHVDAPAHFIPGAPTIDQMPYGAGCGRARVIHIKETRPIAAQTLAPHRIRNGERILIKTANSEVEWSSTVLKDYTRLTEEAARFLAERGVVLLGFDYLSIGPEAHDPLLKAGVWILEGLDLSKAKPGSYDLVCLPLKIQDADGAPARAFLIEKD